MPLSDLHFTPSRLRRVRAWALACGLVLAGPTLPGAAQAQPVPSFWNSREVQRENIAIFKKWTGMVERHLAERIALADGCLATKFSPCHWKEWLQLIGGLKSKSPAEQLERINRYINRHPYVWDFLDFWKTPGEFFPIDGNCKDYAIAKYFSLRLMGWPSDKVRLVVLQDLNLNIAHAVLVVYVGDKIMMLDNQIKQVVEANSVRHYQAYYSINEDHWWLHLRQP